MGTIAARKFLKIFENAENIVAMEMLSACQALDLLKPLKPTGAVAAAHACVRKKVPFAEVDRVFAHDIEAIRELIRSGELSRVLSASVGELEW